MNQVKTAEELLQDGLMALSLSPLLSPPLLHYLSLLAKWNKTYNLTAIRELHRMVSHHVLDSLAIWPWLVGEYVLDVGAGAGLPGIPLAIANPKSHFVLIDSNGKKTRFMQEVKRVLQLDNVDVIKTRVEDYSFTKGFDTILSRAFSELTQMISWTKHLIHPSGIWLAMKGHYPKQEVDALTYAYQVKHYTVPGNIGERCCILIENSFKR